MVTGRPLSFGQYGLDVTNQVVSSNIAQIQLPSLHDPDAIGLDNIG